MISTYKQVAWLSCNSYGKKQRSGKQTMKSRFNMLDNWNKHPKCKKRSMVLLKNEVKQDNSGEIMLRDDQTWATPSLLFKISLWNLHSKTSPSLLPVFPLKTNSLKSVYFLPKPKKNVSAKYLPLLFLSSPVSHHLLPCAFFRRHVILSNHHHGRAAGAHHTFVSEAPWEVFLPCSWLPQPWIATWLLESPLPTKKYNLWKCERTSPKRGVYNITCDICHKTK